MPEAAPITERDRQIMAAIADPKGAAAAGGIDPFEYAEWKERPEIRRALDAHDELNARSDQAIARAFRDEMLAEARTAVATLKANARAADALKPPEGAKEATREQLRALAESTRANAHIIRLATRYLNPAIHTPRRYTAHTDPRTHRHRAATQHAASQDASRRGDPSTQHDSGPSTQDSGPPPPSPIAHPDPDATPEQAAQVLLHALRNNDTPHADAGIATAYAFNHDKRKPRPWANYRFWFMQTQAALLGHRSATVHRAVVSIADAQHVARVPVEIHAADGARHRIEMKFTRGVLCAESTWRYAGADPDSS